MDLALFKVRQFRLVNAATLLFATAFYGMLLAQHHLPADRLALLGAAGRAGDRARPAGGHRLARPPASLPAGSASAAC